MAFYSTLRHLGVEVTEEFLEEQMRIHRDIQNRQAQQGQARILDEVETRRREERRWREAEARRAGQQEEEARRKAEEARARQRREREIMAKLEMEKMVRELVVRQKKEEEEARRKAEESRAKREREELEAMRDQERKLREAEAREQEERRKYEETRIRQEREQEEERIRLVERLRQEHTEMGPRQTSLPQVCHRHNTRQGCSDQNCRRLHICRLFLADICKYGVNCRSGHSLTTVHNQVILKMSSGIKVLKCRNSSIHYSTLQSFSHGCKLGDVNRYHSFSQTLLPI